MHFLLCRFLPSLLLSMKHSALHPARITEVC
jgi:hypothetical protein